MTELEIIPHPDEQRTYAELRSEFRAQRLASLRSQMSIHPIGWGVIGDPALSRLHYDAEEWAYHIHRHLSSPVEQDFGLGEVPFPMSVRIEKQAADSLLHESVTWDEGTEGTTDHDAPACGPVEGMTDDELCDYVTSAIEESARV